MYRLPLAALAFIGVSVTAAVPAFAQDAELGEKSFRKCAPCHDVGPEAQTKLGPVLNGLEGRKAGTVKDYTYTEANKNSGLTWDEATFKDYITDPKAKIPQTKMIFAGIKNEKERADLWAYLKQYGPDGNPKK